MKPNSDWMKYFEATGEKPKYLLQVCKDGEHPFSERLIKELYQSNERIPIAYISRLLTFEIWEIVYESDSNNIDTLVRYIGEIKFQY